ncbi:MAG TPA: 4-hydroxythreonine-4-phosphate dehydrogenase PdxA [Polyangiaceae bacterium]|jgi:4-hydroxythreonine-4-phosphate dehydrogenase
MKLAVSIGCPSGIGPEVSVVAAAKVSARVLLVGDAEVVLRAAKARGVRARIDVVDEPTFVRGAIAVWQPTETLAERDRVLGRPSRAGGAAQFAWIDAACDLVSSGRADALVTGPVSKDAIASSGAPGARQFLGHTEHLQRRLRSREVVMAFASESLVTALVSTHIPISAVPRAVTAQSVATATFWLADFLAKTKKRPRVAVAALNPHAGENGRIGRDETRIAAGIARAKKRVAGRAEIFGPVPAETAFRLASRGEWDGVVAMYHDQATIPMKLLGFGEAVNVTLGLPIVRTSVDHGTAYDRAARFDADPRGMLAAMKLAARLV